MFKIDISAVMLTWNSEDSVATCLDSLINELENSNLKFEIYIVDNGSTDRTKTILTNYKRKFATSVNVIFLGKNYGTTYPRNIALKKISGRFTIIMDSDVKLSQGSINKLVETIQKDPRIGIAVPRLLYPSGKLQKSTDSFPTIIDKLKRYFFLKAIERRENLNDTQTGPSFVDYAISAMWVIKSDMFEVVGLLDEQIFYSPEDVDFCIRVWKAGYKIVYIPSVKCIHHAQEISRGIRINKSTIQHIIGLVYLFKKHKYLFSKPLPNSNVAQ